MRAAGPILAALADPSRPRIDATALVVVAHPDDETIGFAGQIPRIRDVRVLHVTDGAPRRGPDSRKAGFRSPHDYAEARRRELEAAMALAGLGRGRLIKLDVPDQDAVQRLPDIVRALGPHLEAADVVFTHSYEGGHPDHDCTAFAVAEAAARLASPPAIVEMPFYRGGPAGPVWQDFAPRDGGSVVEAVLPADIQEVKRAMLAAFVSQARVLEAARSDVESFRDASGQDFTVLPNGGDVLYERWEWGLTGQDVLDAFGALRGEA